MNPMTITVAYLEQPSSSSTSSVQCSERSEKPQYSMYISAENLSESHQQLKNYAKQAMEGVCHYVYTCILRLEAIQVQCVNGHLAPASSSQITYLIFFLDLDFYLLFSVLADFGADVLSPKLKFQVGPLCHLDGPHKRY